MKHDSAAALIIDNQVVAATEEERFNRLKHTCIQPENATTFCLESAKLNWSDIDLIAVSHNPYRHFRNWKRRVRLKECIFRVAGVLNAEHLRYRLRRTTKAKVQFINHHLSHAAYGYFSSHFEEANILVIDGSGESESFSFFHAKGKNLEYKWNIPTTRRHPRSIGGMYSAATLSLRLGQWGQGKTMGLASYGNPVVDLSKIFAIDDHKRLLFDHRKFRSLCKLYSRVDPTVPFTQEQKDFAASVQAAIERNVIALAKEAYLHTKCSNFVVVGGVALNCNMNSRLLEQDFCRQIFVPPAANDSGLAIGAALYLANSKIIGSSCRVHTAYLGPEFTSEQIESVLKRGKYKYIRSDNIELEVARILSDGQIVGWFQGRMEIGPRALGNRSILASPLISGMNDRINSEVKNRERWRPFGPAVVQDAAAQYFEGFTKIKESPYMLHTFKVRKEFQKVLSSITHIDGTTRPQTVSSDQNPRFYRLLKLMESINGYPILLNTSFNVDGEPIVCTPQNAVACFFNSGLDVLAIGDFLVRKF